MSNVEFELDDGPAIEALLDAYPDPVQICDLPHVSEDVEDKVDIARAVFREGLLLVFDPLSGGGGRERTKNLRKDAQQEGDEVDDDPF